MLLKWKRMFAMFDNNDSKDEVGRWSVRGNVRPLSEIPPLPLSGVSVAESQ